jgi:hypothetical protein
MHIRLATYLILTQKIKQTLSKYETILAIIPVIFKNNGLILYHFS